MKIFRLFLAAAVSAVMMQACSTAPSAEQKTDEAIKGVMEEFQAVGISAAVVQNGEIVYNKAFGFKNLETQEPLATDDFMRIASISKSFTATSLMQLVDKGVVSLDADVSDLIGFKIRNPHHPEIPITLKMVLSHTASIKDKEDYFTLDHLNPAIYGDCVESYFEYKPGEGYNYSNMGLNLAGAILEKLSGQRFDDYVRENVIWKLGLYGGHNNDSLDMSKCALIYKKEDGQWVASEGAYRSRAEDMPSYVMGYSAPIFSPTGGVKISAQDLAKYMMMHMNYGEYNGVRIISQESAKAMQTPVRVKEDPNAAEYALCLTEMAGYVDEEKYNTPGNYPIGHTGGAYGLNSVMIWSPVDNWGIVAMTNGYVSVEGKSFLKTLTKAIYNANIKK